MGFEYFGLCLSTTQKSFSAALKVMLSWTAKFPWERFKADFEGWHADVQTVIDRADRDACYRWSLHYRPAIRNWSTSRATLVADWYERIKARPSYQAGIIDWLDPNYLTLMNAKGEEAWPKVEAIIAEMA